MKNFFRTHLWKEWWATPANRWGLLITIALLVTEMIFFGKFLVWNETRQGSIIHDPLYSFFQPVDFSAPIFLAIYIGIFTALISFREAPEELLPAVHAYMIMIGFRMLMMSLIPLEPDPRTIVLRDPFVELTGSGGAVLTKDLFFSGHTSTMFLLFLVARQKMLKYILFVAFLLVALMVIWQYIHYSIDVVVAPFVAYTSWRISLLFHKDYMRRISRDEK